MSRPNIISVVALLWIIIMAFRLFADATTGSVSAMILDTGNQAKAVSKKPTQKVRKTSSPSEPGNPEVLPIPVTSTPSVALSSERQTAIIAPYSTYAITQGLHVFSYGQMAIDLTGGKGAIILSPINGTVVQGYIDNLGNTVLVIENEVYQITLMHGNYTVTTGETLRIGQPVGQESNNGNTVDGWGQSCRGRDCGYHSHLNIFDKRIGASVNPLNIIQNK